MGLEALSRGAASAVFVESDRDACRTIERNLEKLSLRGAEVACRDVLRFLAAERRRFDLILVDPPYDVVESVAVRLATYLPAVLAESGLVVLESSSRLEPELPPLALRTSRRYGSARVSLFEAAA
jgi:16S rRNA (guanine966-N2)-methyltransferase